MKNEHYKIGGLFIGFFGSATILVSMGAVLGLLSLAFVIGGAYLFFSK